MATHKIHSVPQSNYADELAKLSKAYADIPGKDAKALSVFLAECSGYIRGIERFRTMRDVKKAIDLLETKIADLEDKLKNTTGGLTQADVDAATAPLKQQITDLQAALDKANAQVQTDQQQEAAADEAVKKVFLDNGLDENGNPIAPSADTAPGGTASVPVTATVPVGTAVS